MQRINLYTREFQPDRSPLRLAHMGAACVAAAVLLLLYSVWCAQKNADLEQSLAQASAHTAELTDRRDELAVRSAKIRSESLDAQVDQTRAAIEKRRQLRRLIERQDLGNARGFSEPLRALARQSHSRMALQSFRLSHGGRYASLSGMTVSPPLVPAYLEKLRGEPAFAETAMGVIRLESADAGAHHFTVAPAGQEDNTREP